MMEYGHWRRGEDDPVQAADIVLRHFRLEPGHDPRRKKAEVDAILEDLDEILDDKEYPEIIAGFGATLDGDEERTAAAEALAVLLKGEKQ